MNGMIFRVNAELVIEQKAMVSVVNFCCCPPPPLHSSILCSESNPLLFLALVQFLIKPCDLPTIVVPFRRWL